MAEQKSRYLEYLPAIYAEHPFLGRFLLPFEEVLQGFGDLLADIDRYFDPARTDPDFLSWLATWVALVLDEQWDEAKRRQLIAEAVGLYRWRGTVQGLKRYLKIYAGLEPEIREWHWPGGLQVGVASQIGGIEPAAASLAHIEHIKRSTPSVYYDYYVVDTVAPPDHPSVPPGQPLRLYYRADRVERVEVDTDARRVRLWRLPPDGGPATEETWQPAEITRCDGLIDELYWLWLSKDTSSDPDVEFRGDTFLVDEVEEEQPYRFIVDVRVPVANLGQVQLDKVRAILDLEKPAHTVYYLKLTPVVSEYALQPIQVGIRSTTGLDTTVG